MEGNWLESPSVAERHTSIENPLLDVLIVDSGAIIKGHGANFHKLAKRLVTIEEVVSEIRDSKSRDLLLKLPFELEICTPSSKAMKAVADFARESGDFAALSLTDLKVLALVYALEFEMNDSGKHIRLQPAKKALLPKNGDCSGTSTLKNNVIKIDQEASGESTENSLKSEMPSLALTSQRFDSNKECFSLDGDVENGVECSEKNNEENDIDAGEDFDDDYEYDSEEDEETPAYMRTDWGEWADDVPKKTDSQQTDIDLNSVTEMDFPALGVGSAAPSHEPVKAQTSGWATIAASAQDKVESAAPLIFARNISESNNSSIMKTSVPFNALEHFSGNGHNPELAMYLKQESLKDALKQAAELNELANVTKAGPGYASKLSSTASRILGGGGNFSALAMERARLEDDGEGWISKTNMRDCIISGKNMIGSQILHTGFDASATNTKKQKNKKKKNAEQPLNQSPVGCVTTDFTMQNVMLQMNLRVVSIDGMQIRSIRQWVMRCMACYTLHKDMNRIFCSRCGVDHMSRVACSVDAATGQLHLHLKKGYTVSKRGKVYSMPAPGKQGRFEGELLTREDQLMTGIWRQKVVKMQKDVRSAFGHDVTGDVGLQINKSQHIRPGLGRPNPNADKGRERRGKGKGRKK